MTPRLWLYGEGSRARGVGHLVRLAALADVLGEDALLTTRSDPQGLHGWAWAGRPVREVAAATAQEAVARLRADFPTALPVLDHYDLSNRDVTGAVVLDDVPGRDLSQAALVVSSAPEPAVERYACPVVGGLPHALVRRAFRVGGAHDGGVLVLLGGTDHRRAIPRLAAALRAAGHTVEIALAVASNDLRAAVASDDGIRLHVGLDAPGLAALMGRCRVGVVAASTVSLEAASCGLPIVAVQSADNQAAVRAGLAAAGVPTCSIGDIPAIVAALPRAIAPPGCDGRGAERVAERIAGILVARDLVISGHRLRAAAWPDAARLHGWANDAETRAASLRPDPIPWDGHLAWLRACILDPDRRLFVVEEEGLPVGTVRLDREGTAATVSLTVAPELRGEGHGKRFLALLTAWAQRSGFAERLVAWVRDDNPPSLALFRAAGYRLVARGTPGGHAAGEHHLDLRETP